MMWIILVFYAGVGALCVIVVLLNWALESAEKSRDRYRNLYIAWRRSSEVNEHSAKWLLEYANLLEVELHIQPDSRVNAESWREGCPDYKPFELKEGE